MVEHSKAIVQATLTPDSNTQSPGSQCTIEADDYWRPRLEAIVQHWEETRLSMPIQSLSIAQAPSPHCGLGSGTQMACTVATLLLAAEQIRSTRGTSTSVNLSVPTILKNACTDGQGASSSVLRTQLAELSRRGKRSNVGLSGFIEGGFVFDQGILNSEKTDVHAERTKRIPFPEAWPILIIQNDHTLGDSGLAEAEMFDRCSKTANPNRATMIKLVEQELLPAMASGDWKHFDVALGWYGQLAGEIFAIAQGGIYRTPQIAQSIEAARSIGIDSATQSSWGPSVCAVAQDYSHAHWCAEQLKGALPNASIHVVQAANRSARVTLS
jgi:predicted sugar kinase